MSKLNDEQLVSLFITGNNEAFDILLKRYESKIFSYIAYSVKNQEVAEDIFQDVFMRVISMLRSGRYTEQQKFAQWIMRITHNHVIDYFRQQKNEKAISCDESDVDPLNNASIADNDNAEQRIINQNNITSLEAIIEMLPENQREIIRLRYYQDLSFKEIAELTHVSINTALGRVRYALINLRRLAAQYDISIAS